jgi:hypothetical protein
MFGYARMHRNMVVATFSLITDRSLIPAGKLGKMWTAKILYITSMIMVMMMMIIILKFIAFFKYTFPKQEELYGTIHIIPQTNIWTLDNDQLDAQILIHLLQSSTCTCFEQYLAHPQEVKLY